MRISDGPRRARARLAIRKLPKRVPRRRGKSAQTGNEFLKFSPSRQGKIAGTGTQAEKRKLPAGGAEKDIAENRALWGAERKYMAAGSCPDAGGNEEAVLKSMTGFGRRGGGARLQDHRGDEKRQPPLFDMNIRMPRFMLF